jgi:hypothetical protein
MKIKGSIEFDDVNKIKENLEKLIKLDGHCGCIDCNSCIFSMNYAEDKNFCSGNSIFSYGKTGNFIYAKEERAAEILKEIENNEN